MWAQILASLLPLALKILNSYFESKEASNDARAAYLKFLQVMQKGQNTPAKLKNSYDDQVRRLEALKDDDAV